SGSGTLLIEAGLRYPSLTQLVGVDNDKKHLSTAYRNVTSAGLIRRIQLLGKNILDLPRVGGFDVFVSDVPFVVSMSKGEDLRALYQAFAEFCTINLRPGGTIGVYTSEVGLIKELLAASRFAVTKEVKLEFMTNVNAYLRPSMLICHLE